MGFHLVHLNEVDIFQGAKSPRLFDSCLLREEEHLSFDGLSVDAVFFGDITHGIFCAKKGADKRIDPRPMLPVSRIKRLIGKSFAAGLTPETLDGFTVALAPESAMRPDPAAVAGGDFELRTDWIYTTYALFHIALLKIKNSGALLAGTEDVMG